MLQVSTFLLLTSAATVTFLVIVLTSRASGGARLATGVFAYSLFISLTAFAVTLARTLQLLPPGILSPFLTQALIYRGWIPIGAGLAGAGLIGALKYRVVAGERVTTAAAFSYSPRLLQALCLSASLSYFAVEVGKVTHDADMRRFFQDSGLPAWANYAVIVAELIGASALFHRALRVPAAIGLSVLMIGGILTHAHNGDPFTDSLEALHLLLMLGSILVIALARAAGQEQTLSVQAGAALLSKREI